MKINIIGGGPAGLYFAILMKKSNPKHQITVYERNGPDDTFGWGVVFSGKTLANLRAADIETHAQITRAFAAWDNVDVVHGDTKISIHGNSFSGIARLELLKILQRRCEQLGVELLFRTAVPDVDSLRTDCDLLLAADGVNSTARKQYSNEFIPSLDVRPNRYIWYGTNKLFHGLTLTFCENVVMIGDALHTAHFSIGSGTKLALEDAIALFECFGRTNNVSAALTEFESTRKAVIEEYQAAAFESMRWFENARQYLNLSPLELAYELMMRSGRVSYEDLEKRDPGFIAAYEEQSAGAGGRNRQQEQTADGRQEYS